MQDTRVTSIWTRFSVLACLTLIAPPGFADDDDDDDRKQTNVEVSFGRGLNTAQPGNAANHAVLPNEIRVRVGGVVDFGVAGFHDIIIFKPGFKLQDLIDAGGGQLPTNSLFPFVLPPVPTDPLPADLAFLADKIYYRGINPAGGPPGTPSVASPSNSMNRSEPVAFLAKGNYLVICNVRPHLLDGMWAIVKVRD